jgi:Right handed beta helix region
MPDRSTFLLALFLLAGSLAQPPAAFIKTTNVAGITAALKIGRGVIELPAGTIAIHRELVIPDRAGDIEIRGHPSGSTLKAAADFKGRAVITSTGATNLRFNGFRIDGTRAALQAPVYLPPSDIPFARYYFNNGIRIVGATRVTIRNLSFTEVANFPLLLSASSGVSIEGVTIEDSGSLNERGRNNTSGGILLEEGTTDFQIRSCTIRRVRGNGIWTHSNYHSPRNANGTIEENSVEDVARDAIEVGHATNVRVERNSGSRIGYPFDQVDLEGLGTPVAIDTAGNVDKSLYRGNHFNDVNGQCIDLDGFHDGEVSDNSCVSRKPVDQYPFAHCGIVFGNSNPDMQPENVTVRGNIIDGAGYGGIFLIGSGQRVLGNHFLNLNRHHCTGDMAQAGCNYAPKEPAMLRSGIYLGRGAGRPAETTGNRIQGNEITGFGMRRWCIAAAPGVSLSKNRIENNRCADTSQAP